MHGAIAKWFVIGITAMSFSFVAKTFVGHFAKDSNVPGSAFVLAS